MNWNTTGVTNLVILKPFAGERRCADGWPEYEFYDERCHSGRLTEMDIYVPVIRG